jgi:hypothetical protein
MLGQSFFDRLTPLDIFQNLELLLRGNIRRTFLTSCLSSMSFLAFLERLTSLPHFCLIGNKQVNGCRKALSNSVKICLLKSLANSRRFLKRS